MKEEVQEIELKTEEVNELLSAVPPWLARWGILLIFLVMVATLSLSFFIKYPDTLSAMATITTLNPPVTLLAKTSGKIMELHVADNQQVQKGTVLLVIESNADYLTILKTDSLLNSLPAHLTKYSTQPALLISPEGIDGEGLGELTPAYISFLKSYNDYKLQLEMMPQQKEIAILDQQLGEYRLLQTKYDNQQSTYKEELALIEKDFNRSTVLFNSGVISTKEVEAKKGDYLSAKRSYENMKITSINNQVTISNLEKNKLQLQMQAYQDKEKFAQAFNQSKQALKAQMETWKQTYLLKAPVSGKVSLFSYWTKNQNLKQGDEVLSIVPVKKQKTIAKLMLPVHNSGKLKTGQTVNIKLNNYPYQEYGMLKGKVKSISSMPKNDRYSIEVALPNQLKTTYNKTLTYRQAMQGTADIITEDLSVFDRVFYQFRKMVKR